MAVPHGNGHLLLNCCDLFAHATRLLSLEQLRSHGIDEMVIFLALHLIHNFLQNIVRILILDHLEQVAFSSVRLLESLHHEQPALLVCAVFQTLFDDVAREFMLGISNEVVFHHVDRFRFIFG